MLERVTQDAAGAGIGMDLAVIAQLKGDKETGLAIQRESLALHQLFGTGTPPGSTSLRVLALAADTDIGGNIPLDFLIQGQDICLATVYLGDNIPLPAHIPAHDIAIVVAPGSADGEFALRRAAEIMPNWPVPVLNHPEAIRNLERDRLHHRLDGIAGISIPPTWRVCRDNIAAAALSFPIIIRPVGSHAGFGLAKLDAISDLAHYLEKRDEAQFFVSSYIDYASDDGWFRKYRIALIGGRAFPVHMAIADEWKVWYLNADMAANVNHRVEEAIFMQFFDEEFGQRHGVAIDELARAIGLDYVLIDCAETRQGELLIFEADHCAIVHDMDPANVYPYKQAHMKNLFEAFGMMLARRAGKPVSRAA